MDVSSKYVLLFPIILLYTRVFLRVFMSNERFFTIYTGYSILPVSTHKPKKSVVRAQGPGSCHHPQLMSKQNLFWASLRHIELYPIIKYPLWYLVTLVKLVAASIFRSIFVPPHLRPTGSFDIKEGFFWWRRLLASISSSKYMTS